MTLHLFITSAECEVNHKGFAQFRNVSKLHPEVPKLLPNVASELVRDIFEFICHLVHLYRKFGPHVSSYYAQQTMCFIGQFALLYSETYIKWTPSGNAVVFA